MKKLLRRETGAVLPMAMILLMVGAIVIVPLLNTVSTGSLIERNASFAETGDYAEDAGIEDAIWELQYNNLGGSIPNEDDETSYTLDDQINGETVNVTVKFLGTLIASDDFETHNWSGGSGWAGNWSVTGQAAVTQSHNPIQGTHHVEIDDPSGTATRTVDLSGQPSALNLQLWARVENFEDSDDGGDDDEGDDDDDDDDLIFLRMSPDGVSWTNLTSWDSTDSDGIYNFVDIDLTGLTVSNQTRIEFDADIDSDDGMFLFDDLNIVGPPRYEITSRVGSSETKAVVSIDGGQATILSWK